MSLSEELKQRGFIHQTSNEDLGLIFDQEKRTVYHGIDPSADSAHVGNMVIWMMLKHLTNSGFKLVFLVGGGTGMIGDPKPDSERQLKTREEVNENVQKIKKQAEKFFEGTEVIFVDNYDWLGKLSLIEFLRDVGKNFTVNDLLKKDAIKTRLDSETGLSYTEFAYPILQGFDYLQLYKNNQATLQVGGSDQWGNMVTGIDLIRRKEQAEVFVSTVPLVVDKATGKKFGKSEGNAVWLDGAQTSPYKFYQFWLNTSDESAEDYLKIFTLLPISEITEIVEKGRQNPSDRLTQKTLAKSVTTLVHSEEQAESAEVVSRILFGGEVDNITEEQKQMLLDTAPSSQLGENKNITDVLVETGLAQSKREARTFIEGGAVRCGGNKIDSEDYEISDTDFTSNILLLNRGKKNLHILQK